jgi:hypothetical protein
MPGEGSTPSARTEEKMGELSWTGAAQLLSGGGVLAFAFLVWLSLRDFKSELKLHRVELEEHRKDESKTREDLLGLVKKLVERDRSTDAIVEAVKKEISGVHDVPILPSVVVEDEDPTPVDAPSPRRARGERAPSPVVIVRRSRGGDKDRT